MENLLNIPSTMPVAESAPEAAPAVPEAQIQEPVPEKEGLASPRLAAIAQKERAMLQKRMEMKRYDQELRHREQQVRNFDQLRQSAKINPIKTLESLGLNYTDLTNYVLNGEKPTPEAEINGVKDEIERLKQAQYEKEQRQIQQQVAAAQQEYEEQLNDYREGIAEFTTANDTDYKLLNAYDAHEMVLATTHEHFRRTRAQGKPKLLSMKEAADLVEGYLRDEVTKGHSLLSPPQVQTQSGPDEERSTSKTLNNQMLSSAPSMLTPSVENDRIRRALAKLG